VKAMPPIAARDRLRLFTQADSCIIAAFYAYGVLIHNLIIASVTGISCPDAPLKWQILDIVYLVLDVVVVVGLIRGSWLGIGAFFLAASSQIALYTCLPGLGARRASGLPALPGGSCKSGWIGRLPRSDLHSDGWDRGAWSANSHDTAHNGH